ncbi:hypothetical protein OIU78_026013 [Salix suchowensis]|nr:hypothetical protein OIU78_026013 [Salix suchowensis]
MRLKRVKKLHSIVYFAVQDLTRDTSLASLIVNSRAIGVCKAPFSYKIAEVKPDLLLLTAVLVFTRDTSLASLIVKSRAIGVCKVISIPRRDETISPVGAVSAPCTMDLQECRFSLQTSRASLNVKSRAIGVCKGGTILK